MEDIYPEKKYYLLNMKGKIYNYIRENWYRDPTLTSEDIQKEFGISKATASEHLSDLEKIGLIKRKKVGKKKYIYLTEFNDFFRSEY